ncbi:MAG: hypothetical protein LIO76_01585 [Clostridiales bacterium]|nr:hypothetical protein [Clostridiales bacterium]
MKTIEKNKKSDNPNFSESSDSCATGHSLSEWSDSFLSGSVSSGTECTGLMPTPPASADELESYEELYPFRPNQVVADHKNI